ncbi:hypothetical protein POVWA2_003850 [Plasmodium ovale wallikeri]|uniref:Uncharacterized protein n=1 Tax=Plasmodium ovale wallikeri TaxID=864142 RepID=A0A1A8YJ56_PLAOA|nr:hypothetical protein POVWA1_003710 [Plasmodium ovale wallikeri]SBT31382.1 hypothetical protein POVWA2_003850 [Plasmodium ovale wallikeri]
MILPGYDSAWQLFCLTLPLTKSTRSAQDPNGHVFAKGLNRKFKPKVRDIKKVEIHLNGGKSHFNFLPTTISCKACLEISDEKLSIFVLGEKSNLGKKYQRYNTIIRGGIFFFFFFPKVA